MKVCESTDSTNFCIDGMWGTLTSEGNRECKETCGQGWGSECCLNKEIDNRPPDTQFSQQYNCFDNNGQYQQACEPGESNHTCGPLLCFGASLGCKTCESITQNKKRPDGCTEENCCNGKLSGGNPWGGACLGAVCYGAMDYGNCSAGLSMGTGAHDDDGPHDGSSRCCSDDDCKNAPNECNDDVGRCLGKKPDPWPPK